MSRKTFDPDAEVLLPPHGQPAFVDDGRLPCRWCRMPTLRVTLAQYGARCYPCFEAYCSEPQPAALLADKRLGLKAWAWALKAREEHDPKSLTAAARDMWRAALQPELARQQAAALTAAEEGAT